MAASNIFTNYICWFAVTNAQHYSTENADNQDIKVCTPEKGFTTVANLLYVCSSLVSLGVSRLLTSRVL